MNEISVLSKKKKNKGLKRIPRSFSCKDTARRHHTIYGPDSTVYQDGKSCPKFDVLEYITARNPCLLILSSSVYGAVIGAKAD